MNNIDKLFKEKLETHRAIPSAAAWQKLEEELKKGKNNKIIVWMSVAASLLLILVSIAYFRIDVNVTNPIKTAQLNQIEVERNTSEQTIIAISESEAENNNSQNIALQVTVKEEEDNHNSTVSKNESITTIKKLIKNKPTHAKKEENYHKKETYTTDTKIAENRDVIIKLLETNLDQLQAINNNNKEDEVLTSSSVKIVYNLEPVIKIDPAILINTPKENSDKNKVLGKIVAFAKNVKTPEVGLGQLRAAKDDFLSLDNFKNNNKQQAQK